MASRPLIGRITYGSAIQLTRAALQYITRSSVSSATNNITISLWVKLNSLPGATMSIFHNGETDGNGYNVRISAAGVLNTDLSFVANLSSGQTLTTGTLYHIVVTRTANVWQHWMGTLGGTATIAVGSTISNSPNSPGGNTTIGADRTSGNVFNDHFDGVIDDVRLYERALSAGEIGNLFNQATDPSVVVDAGGLKLWYKLNETSGSTVADSSGNGSTGTVSGGASFVTSQLQLTNIPNRPTSGVRQTSGTRTAIAI